jgi:hypothetical protein
MGLDRSEIDSTKKELRPISRFTTELIFRLAVFVQVWTLHNKSKLGISREVESVWDRSNLDRLEKSVHGRF